MRRLFLIPINHVNLEKILSFCVNSCIEDCLKSNDKSIALIKLREGYELPKYFKGLEEVVDDDFFIKDERFKTIIKE